MPSPKKSTLVPIVLVVAALVLMWCVWRMMRRRESYSKAHGHVVVTAAPASALGLIKTARSWLISKCVSSNDPLADFATTFATETKGVITVVPDILTAKQFKTLNVPRYLMALSKSRNVPLGTVFPTIDASSDMKMNIVEALVVSNTALGAADYSDGESTYYGMARFLVGLSGWTFGGQVKAATD
jgi:hypothetical protein